MDMCIDMCMEMHMDMCIDMCMEMHMDMCIDMCVNVLVDFADQDVLRLEIAVANAAGMQPKQPTRDLVRVHSHVLVGQSVVLFSVPCDDLCARCVRCVKGAHAGAHAVCTWPRLDGTYSITACKKV